MCASVYVFFWIFSEYLDDSLSQSVEYLKQLQEQQNRIARSREKDRYWCHFYWKVSLPSEKTTFGGQFLCIVL